MRRTPNAVGWNSDVKRRYPARERKRVKALLRAAGDVGAEILAVTEPKKDGGLRVHAQTRGLSVDVDVKWGEPYRITFGDPGRMVEIGKVSSVAEVAIMLRMLRTPPEPKRIAVKGTTYGRRMSA